LEKIKKRNLKKSWICIKEMSTITLRERIDITSFTAIMNNIDYYIDKMGGAYDPRTQEKIHGKAYITILNKYFNHLNEDGVGETTYTQRTKIGKRTIGRFCAKNSQSLQNISRPLRHTIAGGIYWDVDISNCHPEIALQLSKKYGIQTPYLEDYIKHRKAILSQVQNELSISKDDAKREFLRALNAGTMNKDFESCKLLVDFFGETDKVRRGLKEHFPEFFAEAEKKSGKKKFYNPMGTGINYVFCYYENEMLQIMLEEARKLQLECGVLAFDGLMIEKEGVSHEFIENVYFKACIDKIKEVLQFDISLAIKDPDEGFEILKEHIEVVDGKPLLDVDNQELINYWDSQKVQPNKTISNRFISKDEYDEFLSTPSKLSFVKGNMGCGKTFGLIEKFKDKSILIVSYRRSLDSELARKFECKLYSDFDTSFIVADRLVVQIDSVWRVRGSYDVVILDEVGYSQNHFFQFTKDKHRCLDALRHFCNSASKVIAMDALLQKRNINWVCDVAGTQNYHVLQNTFKVFNGYKCTIKKGNRFNLYSAVKAAIALKQKVVIPSNSLEALKFIEANIKSEFPHIKFLLIDKDSEEVIIDEWVNYDIVSYTPSIEAGVSFEKRHFNKCIAYMTNQSNSPSNFAQMLFRVRNLIDKEMVIISSQTYLNNNPTSEEGIIMNLQNDIRACSEAGLTPDYGSVNFNPDLSGYNKHWFATKIGGNWDRTDFKGYVRNALVEHGVDVFTSDNVEDLDKEVKQHLTEVKKDADNNEILAIYASRDISQDEYERLKAVETRRPILDTRAIRKYECMRTYGRSLTDEEFVALYPLQSEFKNAKLIRAGRAAIIKVIAERGNGLTELGLLNENERFIALNESLSRCKPVLKPLFVSDLMASIGFNLQEFLRSGGTLVDDKWTKIDNDKLKDFLNSRIDTFMSLTRSKKDFITSVDNQLMKSVMSMLKSCGISLKSHRTQVAGERTKEYTLESVFVNGFNVVSGLGELTTHDFDWGDDGVEVKEVNQNKGGLRGLRGLRCLQKARK